MMKVNGEMKFFDQAERRKREARRQRLRSVLVPTIPLDPRPEIDDDDETDDDYVIKNVIK